MRLLGSAKKVVDTNKSSENESVEAFLVHCNLVKNYYQHLSKVLLTFVPNKLFGQLINISPNFLTNLNEYS